jgi:hypothetical protein
VKWIKCAVSEDKTTKTTKMVNLDLVTHANFTGASQTKWRSTVSPRMTPYVGVTIEVSENFRLTLHFCGGAKVDVTDPDCMQEAIKYLGIQDLISPPSPEAPE